MYRRGEPLSPAETRCLASVPPGPGSVGEPPLQRGLRQTPFPSHLHASLLPAFLGLQLLPRVPAHRPSHSQRQGQGQLARASFGRQHLSGELCTSWGLCPRAPAGWALSTAPLRDGDHRPLGLPPQSLGLGTAHTSSFTPWACWPAAKGRALLGNCRPITAPGPAWVLCAADGRRAEGGRWSRGGTACWLTVGSFLWQACLPRPVSPTSQGGAIVQ